MKRHTDHEGRAESARPQFLRNGIELFAYERIVWSRARARHRAASRPHCDVEDLAQEGWIALMHAADIYQSDRGAKFSTFAWRVVDRAVLRAVYNLKFPPNSISESRSLRETASQIIASSDLNRTDAKRFAYVTSSEPLPHWKAQLHDAFDALTRTCSRRERMVLSQIALLDKSASQVARDLGVRTQAISNHIVRARSRANLAAVSA